MLPAPRVASPSAATLSRFRPSSNRPHGPSSNWVARSIIRGRPVNAGHRHCCSTRCPCSQLAALYLAMGASPLPVLWRERRGTREIGYATALVFPAVGVAAALLVVQILVTREPLAGHPFAAFAGILIVALPLVAVVRNWDERNLLAPCGARTRPSNAPAARPRAGRDRPPLTPAVRCRRPTEIARAMSSTSSRSSANWTWRTSRWSRTRTHGAHPCGARKGTRQRVHDRAGGLARARAWASAPSCATAAASRSSTPRRRRS